jgi:hypothetical protein
MTLGTVARGQEVPPAPPPVDPLNPVGGPVEVLPTFLPPPPPTPPPVVPALPDWREGHEWVPAGPAGADALSGIAVGTATTWAIAQTTGAVWITEDAGAHWARVLEPFFTRSNDEEILREVEARVGEISGNFDTSGWVSEDDLQAMVEDAQQASQQVVDELQSELDAGPWFLEHQAALAGDLEAAHPRVWFTSDGRLVVGRADGLRVAEHTGQGWVLEQTWADPVTAFTELPDHTFLHRNHTGNHE